MTKLQLDIRTSPDCTSIIVDDISVYNDITKVTNLILEIKGPGQTCSKSFIVLPLFKKVITCSDLNLCCSECPEDSTELPDGNYEIKFSRAPNLDTMVEFNYFRNCKQFKEYVGQNCRLFESRNSMTQKDFGKRTDELFLIKEQIQSAKYAAEECLNVEGALGIYEDVQRKLKQLLRGRYCKDC